MSTVRIGTLDDAHLDQLGIAIIREHARAAAVALVKATTPAYRAELIHESLVFFQGSGLEATIRLFGLEIDAETFREVYFNWCDYQRRHQPSPSLSPTIGARTSLAVA